MDKELLEGHRWILGFRGRYATTEAGELWSYVGEAPERVRTLRRAQVEEARRRAAAGENIGALARELDAPYFELHRAVQGITWFLLKDPPPVPGVPRK